jgi:hypothetical protein
MDLGGMQKTNYLSVKDNSYFSARLAGPINPDFFYTIAEVCIILCKAKSGVFLAIRDGRLKARKDGRRTLVTGQSLLDYMAALPPAVLAD